LFWDEDRILRIVTVSTCDLSRGLTDKHHIAVIPMAIHVGEQSFYKAVFRLPGAIPTRENQVMA
jgi:hypothetical protein